MVHYSFSFTLIRQQVGGVFFDVGSHVKPKRLQRTKSFGLRWKLSPQLCFCYMMFLDAWVIVLSIYKYFILFFIFLTLLMYSLRFLRKKFKLLVKMIYLSIYFLHVRLNVRLDYDNINSILLLFPKKKFLYFFPLWNCTLGFFKRKKSYNLLFFPFFIFYYFELHFCWVLLIFFRYITQCFWFYGKKKKNWVWESLLI